MTGLADFLRARYAERRAIAEAASPWPWKINPDDPEEVLANDDILVADVFALSSNQTRNTATFIATNDPADVLADLDAKLALLKDLLAERHDVVEDCWYTCAAATEERDGGESCNEDRQGGPCDCGRDARVNRRLRILARPFTGHPDYQEDWAA